MFYHKSNIISSSYENFEYHIKWQHNTDVHYGSLTSHWSTWHRLCSSRVFLLAVIHWRCRWRAWRCGSQCLCMAERIIFQSLSAWLHSNYWYADLWKLVERKFYKLVERENEKRKKEIIIIIMIIYFIFCFLFILFHFN